MDSPNAALWALSDPNRRKIFERLHREGELSVARLTEGLGISQPAVSRHLKLLYDYGLVEVRPAGRHRYYQARSDALVPVTAWLNGLTVRRKPFDATEWLRAHHAKLALARDDEPNES